MPLNARCGGSRYGMKGVVHEIEDVYPYWELLRDVNPDRGEGLMKGIWEANIKDWDALHYNRHGDFKKQVDHANNLEQTLERIQSPRNQWRSLVYQCRTGYGLTLHIAWATKTGGGTADVGGTPLKSDSTAAGSRDWYLGDLVHPQSGKRGLNVFGRKYPQATEPRVYVGNQLNHTITQMMGMLTIVENAQKYGRIGEMAHIKATVAQHIIGFLDASYDRKNNTLKSIVIDGTDLTGFRIQGPFRDAKLSFGAKEGGAFLPQNITPLFTAVCAVGIGFPKAEASSETIYVRCLKPLGSETSVPIRTLHPR